MRNEAPFRIFERNDYYEMEELVEPHVRNHELGSDSFSHLRVPSHVQADIESSIVHRRSVWPRRSLQPLIAEAIRRNGWLISVCTT